jgi:hypothetical protein
MNGAPGFGVVRDTGVSPLRCAPVEMTEMRGGALVGLRGGITRVSEASLWPWLVVGA